MEKKHILYLVIISFLLCNSIAFLDEGIHGFEYLTHASDWVALLIYTTIFLILPLIIYSASENNNKRFYFALSGFVLPLILIILLI